VSSEGAAPLQWVRFASGEQISIGDSAEIEAGSSIDLIRAGSDAAAAFPFLRIAMHPSSHWTLSYRMATAPDAQDLASITGEALRVPSAAPVAGRLRTQKGRHHEAAVSRAYKGGSIEVALYNDALDRMVLEGGGLGQNGGVSVGEGVLLDPATGAFRVSAPGYDSAGCNVLLTQTILPGVLLAVQYTTGQALGYISADRDVRELLAHLKARQSQSITTALHGSIASTGTKVDVSYRWQPEDLMSSVGLYDALDTGTYLNVHLRQPLRLRRDWVPMDVTVQGTNLLAEGYHPWPGAAHAGPFLAASTRSLEAGLAVRF
jgi:hypothetical protein